MQERSTTVKKDIVITAVLTLITGLVCLAIKGMYPFGRNTIDYYDMAQQITAFYYHVYDFLHGTKPLFFDYYTALGSNQAMSTSGCSNFSIFNLFFLFVERSRVLESLSIFLVIKMVCMALAMYALILVNKVIPSYVHIILSVGYGFCGFVLTLYMTNQWMDVAFLFPLILIGLKKLVCDGKPALYVVFLSLALINSYYISFMILMYIVLILGTKLASDRLFGREDRNYHLFSLGVATAVSMGISSFILIPQLIQTLSSSRFNNESGGGPLSKYMTILETIEPAYTTRWFSLLGLSFTAAIIVTGVVRHRRNKKLLFNLFVSCFSVLLEIFLESTNLIWHFGSYVQYPIRNGFMIYVTLAMAALYVMPEAEGASDASETSEESVVSKRGSWVIGAVVSAVSLLVCVLFIRYYSMHPGLEVRTVFHLLAGLMLATFIVYVALLLYKKGVFARFAPVLVIAEIIIYGYVFIGQPAFITGYTESFEQSGEYIKLCNELAQAFDLEPENIYRMKNPDESLNSNYGLVIRRPVLSNWTHMISPALQDAARRWGYTMQYTRLLDAGGTIFSDALIGVRQIITRIPQDEKLYTLVDSAEIEDGAGNPVTYYLYEPVYTLPWVNTVDARIPEITGGDTVSLHNDVYTALGGEGRIAEYVAEFNAGTDTDIELEIAGNLAVYMIGSCVDCEYKNTSVNVNGKDILIPSIGEYDNIYYPAYYNCNAVYLGTFGNETVDVKVTSEYNGPGQDYKIKIMTVDIGKLAALCDRIAGTDDVMVDGNKIYINKTVSEEDTDIVIPLAYDEGFTVTDNGQNVEAVRYAGLLTKIPAVEGENRIEMIFVPKGLHVGVIISIISLLIAAVYIKFAGKVPAGLDRIAGPVFELIYAGMMFVIYIIPIIYALFICLRRLF